MAKWRVYDCDGEDHIIEAAGFSISPSEKLFFYKGQHAGVLEVPKGEPVVGSIREIVAVFNYWEWFERVDEGGEEGG